MIKKKKKKIKIKICGIKYDIKKIYQLYPDFIGFIFYSQSPRFVGNQFLIPNFVQKVFKIGVFVNEYQKKIIQIHQDKKLDFIQLHGDESPFFCENLFLKNLKIIKSFKIDSSFSNQKLLDYVPFCSYFLFDNNGGSGQKFCWNQIDKYQLDVPFFISGGIDPKDLEKIKKISHPKMFGIDINSKFEIYPGKKNERILKDFIKKIREL